MAAPALSKDAFDTLANGHDNSPWVVSLGAGDQPAVGETILVAVCKYNETDALADITDDAGNTYTQLAVLPRSGIPAPCRIELWGVAQSVGLVTSVTVDFGAGNWSENTTFFTLHSFTGASFYSPQAIRYQESSGTETRVVDTDSLDGTTQIAATGDASLAFAVFFTYRNGAGSPGALTSDWNDSVNGDNGAGSFGHSFGSFYDVVSPVDPLSIELTNDTYTNDPSHGIVLLLTGADDVPRTEITVTDVPPFAAGATLTGVSGDPTNDMYIDAKKLAGKRLVLVITSRHSAGIDVDIEVNARYRTFNEAISITNTVPAAVGAVEGKRAIVLDSATLRRVTSDTNQIWVSSADANFSLCTCYAYTWTPSAGQ